MKSIFYGTLHLLGTQEEIYAAICLFFSCYTGGIRISDLLLLKWCMFDGKHLNFTSYKTNDNLSIMVPTVGREILQIYHQGDF